MGNRREMLNFSAGNQIKQPVVEDAQSEVGLACRDVADLQRCVWRSGGPDMNALGEVRHVEALLVDEKATRHARTDLDGP